MATIPCFIDIRFCHVLGDERAVDGDGDCHDLCGWDRLGDAEHPEHCVLRSVCHFSNDSCATNGNGQPGVREQEQSRDPSDSVVVRSHDF